MLLENVKKLCDQHKTTICALERETGIGNGAIAKWNASDPRLGNVKKVADYFGVTVDDLLAKDEEVSQ